MNGLNDIFIPRGIRNNNPGNIRIGRTRWEGQRDLQDDPDFIEFRAPVYGLRALIKLLLTYHLKYGLDTVESLINRYAPPSENETDNYIFHVAKAMGVRRTAVIDLTCRATLLKLAAAITRHENGKPPEGRPPGWFPPELYERAFTLATQQIQGKEKPS